MDETTDKEDQGLEASRASKRGHDEIDTSDLWTDDECFSDLDAIAEEALINEKYGSSQGSQSNGIRICDLSGMQECAEITVHVETISTLCLTAQQRPFFSFVMKDGSRLMKCMVWHPIATHLFKVLKLGQSVILRNGSVEKMKKGADNYGNEHMLSLNGRSIVVVSTDDCDITVDLHGCQRGPKKITMPQRKKICVAPHIPWLKISQLSERQICNTVELTVTSMITKGVATSRAGKQYVSFVGSDDTGNIRCTILEPYSKILGHKIKDGVHLIVENALVKTVDPHFKTHCTNDYELNVYQLSHVSILRDETTPSQFVPPPGVITEEQMNEITMETEPINTITIEEEPIYEIKLKQEPVESELQDCHTEENIELVEVFEVKVESLVTDALSKTPKGLYYIEFIGFNETVKLRCMIFEPLCFRFFRTLQVGQLLKMTNVEINFSDEICRACGNKLVAKVHGIASTVNVIIEKCTLIQYLNAAKTLEMNKSTLTYVDLFAIVQEYVMGHRPEQYYCHKLTVSDVVQQQTDIMLPDLEYSPGSFSARTVIVLKCLQVQDVNGELEFRFIPGISSIQQT